MHTSDKRILRLIDLLIIQKKISYIKEFCDDIGIYYPTIAKIKKGNVHFTVSHIEHVCQKYDVNANWIFGFENKVFNYSGSIEISGFLEKI